MCGVFGIIKRRPVSAADFVALARQNLHRGNIAFGYIGVTENGAGTQTEINRYDRPFEPVMVKTFGATIMLGHVRAPTNGHYHEDDDYDSLTDVHPLASSSFLLAHNGILLNYFDFPDWLRGFDLDSQAIAGGIQSHIDQGYSVPSAISATVCQLDGQQGCWLWHRATKMIYCWRVMSTLYLGQSECGITFSSSKTSETDRLLPEGVVYAIDPINVTYTAVSEFAYSTPYKIMT